MLDTSSVTQHKSIEMSDVDCSRDRDPVHGRDRDAMRVHDKSSEFLRNRSDCIQDRKDLSFENRGGPPQRAGDKLDEGASRASRVGTVGGHGHEDREREEERERERERERQLREQQDRARDLAEKLRVRKKEMMQVWFLMMMYMRGVSMRTYVDISVDGGELRV